MENNQFENILKSKTLKDNLNNLIEMIEWWEKQTFIDSKVYEMFVLASFTYLYSTAEIIKCKNDISENNPFYIWSYFFDKVKHFDVEFKEINNIIDRMKNDKKFADIFNKAISNGIEKLSINETGYLYINLSCTSKKPNLSYEFANLNEKFIKTIYSEDLNCAVQFWTDYIKPFLIYLQSKGDALVNSKNSNLWNEYLSENKIQNDEFSYIVGKYKTK